MKIITIDGKIYDVKYQQNKETLTNKVGVSVHEFPNFNGSKLYQNSTSSDIYQLTFAIHKTLFVGLKESLKKFLIDEADAVNDPTYGALTDIVIEHPDWGAIKGKFISPIKWDTSSQADIVGTGTFQENTKEDDAEKTDLEQDNADSGEEIDTATDEGELDEFDKPALLQLLEKLNELYDTIQNSAVIAAINDLQSALNDAILNYQKVMNATKKILALPGDIISNVRGKLDLFQKQADAIKSIPRSTFNMTKFNINCLAFNLRMTNRTPFVSKAAQRSRAGIKTAPIE